MVGTRYVGTAKLTPEREAELAPIARGDELCAMKAAARGDNLHVLVSAGCLAQAAIVRAAMRAARRAMPAARRAMRDAQEMFVGSVVGLVVNRAKMHHLHNTQFDDLVQAGMMATVEAIHTFLPERGRWATHVTRWIDRNMRDAANGGLVHLPDEAIAAARRIAKAHANLMERGVPSREDLMNEMDATWDEVVNADAAGLATRGPVSIDAPDGDARSQIVLEDDDDDDDDDDFITGGAPVRDFLAASDPYDHDADRARGGAVRTWLRYTLNDADAADMVYLYAVEGWSFTMIAYRKGHNRNQNKVRDTVMGALRKLKSVIRKQAGDGRQGVDPEKAMIMMLRCADMRHYQDAATHGLMWMRIVMDPEVQIEMEDDPDVERVESCEFCDRVSSRERRKMREAAVREAIAAAECGQRHPWSCHGTEAMRRGLYTR